MGLSFFNTLISCLPNESKELFSKNDIFISTPNLKSPLFNYAAFCKVLSISGINRIVDIAFKILSIDLSSSSNLISIGVQTDPFTRLLQ
jgi:hypothetical protein